MFTRSAVVAPSYHHFNVGGNLKHITEEDFGVDDVDWSERRPLPSFDQKPEPVDQATLVKRIQENQLKELNRVHENYINHLNEIHERAQSRLKEIFEQSYDTFPTNTNH